MKNTALIIPVFLASIFLSCSADKSQENEPVSLDAGALEGSWQRVSYIDQASSDTAWIDVPDNIIYEKHITPTHFTWFSYDKETERTVGTGGGTYTFDGNTYVEDIHFFYPPGSSILGQTIPFTVEMEDGQWHHTGYAKDIEFDAESGEMVVVDSTKIEEMWERVETQGIEANSDLSLVGTWELVSYMDANQQVWTEYPAFVGYIKHITPTHFVWVKYNAEGDEVMGEGGGTYDLSGNSYNEHIHNWFPTGNEEVGTTSNFNIEMKNGKWHLTGYVKNLQTDSANGESVVADSSLIQEIWQPYGGTPAL